MARTSTASGPLLLAILALGALAPPAGAYLRGPQVPVSGTALADFFASQGQAIDAATQQQNAQTFAGINVGQPGSLVFVVRPCLGTASLCAYNAGDAASPLFTVFPGSASAGWYSVVSFPTSPDRMVVQLFDATDALQGTQAHTGISIFGLGLATVSAGGTRFSEDALNAGGEARLLFYAATGDHAGAAWLCGEDSDGPGADFADNVFLLGSFGPVPTARTSWGRIKRLYR